MMKMFDAGTIYIAPNLDVSSYILDDDVEGLIALIERESPTDPSITVCTPADFRPEFHEGLAADFELLKSLCKAWEALRADPKLDAFLARLDAELLDAGRNHPAALGRSPKLVIFSEAADTTSYLAERLKKTNRRLLVVDSKLRRKLNALERNQKKAPVQPHVLLERTLGILKEFPLLTAEEGGIEENRAGLTAEDLKPALILSESFKK